MKNFFTIAFLIVSSISVVSATVNNEHNQGLSLKNRYRVCNDTVGIPDSVINALNNEFYNDSFNCGTSTVKDYDGNVYNTVQIGNQCWMKENLRTTKYSDGTKIALWSSTSTGTACRYYPNGNASNVATYGYLYNWKAVMRRSSSSSSNPSGVQGICPTGWHVPSDAEWTQLTNYVSSQDIYYCSNTSANIAKALAGSTGWSSSTTACAVGNTPANNNATGFSAVPAGFYSSNGYNYFGNYAAFWSATEVSSGSASGWLLRYRSASVFSYYDFKRAVYSVRCLRD